MVNALLLRFDGTQHTWMMNNTIGSFALYSAGLAPCKIPDAGSLEGAAVAEELAVALGMVDRSTPQQRSERGIFAGRVQPRRRGLDSWREAAREMGAVDGSSSYITAWSYN